jgi:hypothetical protein
MLKIGYETFVAGPMKINPWVALGLADVVALAVG